MGRSRHYEWIALALALGCGDDGDEPLTDAQDAGAQNPSAQDGVTAVLDGGSIGQDATVSRNATITGGESAPGDTGVVVDDGAAQAPRDGGPAVFVDDLTKEQERAHCEALSAAVAEVIATSGRSTCIYAGLLVAAEVPGTCTEVSENCLRMQEKPSAAAPVDCAADSGPPERCPGLTVAEAEACFASYRTVAARFQSFTCRSSIADVTQAIDLARNDTPECKVIQQKCGPA